MENTGTDFILTHRITIRPRFGEVDSMGYVYHGNYVAFCHLGRMELLRKYNLDDKQLEEKGILMPVISMNMKYIKPAGFDDQLEVVTQLKEIPVSRLEFGFEIFNKDKERIFIAESTLCFADSITRKAIRVPDFFREKLEQCNHSQIINLQ